MQINILQVNHCSNCSKTVVKHCSKTVVKTVFSRKYHRNGRLKTENIIRFFFTVLPVYHSDDIFLKMYKTLKVNSLERSTIDESKMLDNFLLVRKVFDRLIGS